jgi:threonine dehydratase
MRISVDDIRSAAAVIAGAVENTPCRHSLVLSQMAGCDVFLKFENLQFTASFKERGALNKLTSLGEAERTCGVIAMSAGNHAQGVAYHASRLGIPATIVMPQGTPHVKVRQTQHFGVRVVLHGEGLEEAAAHARALGDAEGLTFIHPYDDEKIIAGQGTVALEMLDAVAHLDTLVVPVGGGGLIAGCAVAAKAVNPAIHIVGVETELYPSMQQALAGLPIHCGGQTIAEGIAVKAPGGLTLAIARELVDEVLTVRESDIERAIGLLVDVEKTVAEGAGAAALAAVMAHGDHFAGRTCGLILSGGNIDTRLFAGILTRELVREGRVTHLRIGIADRPGALADVARIIADGQGNILEVQHQRMFPEVPAKLAELDIVVETMDRGHVRDIEDRLTAAGYALNKMTP